jgi:cysteinyl-tRNA synthetase
VRELKFFNTLGRELQDFSPIEGSHVRLYTCGPTIYNHVHIGNLRTFLWEDVLRRTLKRFGYRITQVMNLTDVDDKTIRGAAEAGLPLKEFTSRYAESFFSDLETLGAEKAEHYPRATDYIPQMIEIVEKLEERGHTYASDGSVWFKISTFPAYGKLSGINLAEARPGARVADDEYEKEDPKDFALWKNAKPGEPSWPSPWGDGRPGWHLECSAMSMDLLGEHFDIHTGAVDNIFPHHENEIAQSEGATRHPFVNYWLHAEHLIVDGEKMSKSKGNFYLLKDVLERQNNPAAVRYLFLSVPYRQKLNFTWDSLSAAAQAVDRLKNFQRQLAELVELKSAGARNPVSPNFSYENEIIRPFENEFDASLADDLNTAAALGALFKLLRSVYVSIEAGQINSADASRALGALRAADSVIGVLPSGEEILPAEVERLIAERLDARKRRDFARSDAIRDELAAGGIILEDTANGTRWKKA